MARRKQSLVDQRGRIDKIDDQLLSLLAERAGLALEIAKIKAQSSTGKVILRPGREAAVIKGLLARHEGAFPRETIVRLWREIMTAMVRLQGEMEIAIDGADDPVAYWDLARSQFGSAAPATLYPTADRVLRAVVAGEGETVGVLPLPGDDGDASWWTKLIAPEETVPRIIARLPFIKSAHGPGAETGALVVAIHGEREEEADVTVLAITADPQLSRSRLAEWLGEVGLPGKAVASIRPDAKKPAWLHLVNVESAVKEGDDRLEALTERATGGILAIAHLGGYSIVTEI